MKYIKQHIAFKIATLLVVACLLSPVFVKFSHAFSHHEHEVCLGENQSHFHEIDTDCEFFKFKINHNSPIILVDYKVAHHVEGELSETTYYYFLNSHQQLTSFLRGPPLPLM